MMMPPSRSLKALTRHSASPKYTAAATAIVEIAAVVAVMLVAAQNQDSALQAGLRPVFGFRACRRIPSLPLTRCSEERSLTLHRSRQIQNPHPQAPLQ
jgi:hypothetical protein